MLLNLDEGGVKSGRANFILLLPVLFFMVLKIFLLVIPGLEKKLEFQLALGTSSSQILLVLGKS